MKTKMQEAVKGFVTMPGYIKMAIAAIMLFAATSMTSCCPPGGGPGDDPWGDDSTIIK